MAEQAKVPAIRFAGFTDPWEQRKFGELYRPVSEKNDVSFGRDKAISVANMYFNPAVYVTEDSYLATYNVMRLGDIAFEGNRSKRFAHGRFVENTIGDGIVSHVFKVFRHVGDNYDLSYWKHAINNEKLMKDVLTRSTKASTMMHELVTADFLEELTLVPSLNEQRAIGAAIDSIDNLITLHQRKYDKLVVFKKSMLEKMFPKDGESVPEIRFAGFTDPWEQRKLGELALTYSGGTPSAGNSAYYGGEIPFIRSAEIDCDSTELSLTVAGLNNSSAKLVDKGMVLYAMYGATSGEVAISKIKGAINQAILAMDASDMAANRFIAYWLRRQKKSITETFLQGGQGNLSGAIIKELGIPQPSLDEQRQIGSFFSNLDDLITLHQRKLELLQNIKKSLLDKMFV